MNSKQFLESTTSGSVATVATPVGKTQTRGKGIYPNEKGGNLLTGKKTNKKYPNSVSEAKLDEEDVIIVPGQGNRIKPGFIPRKADRTDHEVEMALSDLFQSAKNAKQVYELIKDIPETVGIEGWVQEKIIKANDYLNTVREYLEHKQVGEVNEMFADRGAGHSEKETKADREYVKRLKNKNMSAKPKQDSTKNKEQQGVAESNVFTDARMNAIKAGKDTFVVHGKTYKVTGDTSDEREAGVAEGYRILPNIDRERYQERQGLEGPFRARNGKVYYYDPKAGLAYDPDTDFYIDYDELKMMDREMSEGVDDTKKKISKYEELALAANRAGDDEKCKLYQRKIQALKQKMTQNVDEGKVAGALGALGLLTVLGMNISSGKDTPLGKELEQAAMKGDRVAAYHLDNLDAYIDLDDQRTLVNLKIAYIDDSNRPDVKNYLADKAKASSDRMRESSIMKGIQNEQSDDNDYYGWSTKPTGMRDKMKHELGHEDKWERSTWYIRINGKILKDKQGEPYRFRGRTAANKAAVTMMAKPFNANKKFTLTTSMVDEPESGITEVAKSSFRQSVEDQASRYVEQIKNSNMSDWEKEYLILVNDPKGKIFRAMYHSFPKGQEARKLAVDYIANKYGVSTDEVENLDMNELARNFTESKCPECGGKLVAESELNEEGNKDACYHKVKSRYKVWPSAYASGALVKCRKVGASNWGNKSK